MAVWVRYPVPVHTGANGGNQHAWIWGPYEEIVPPCPANYCRAGGVGLNNIREANEYIRGRIRTDAAGLPLVDGCQWWTDGSADPQQHNTRTLIRGGRKPCDARTSEVAVAMLS